MRPFDRRLCLTALVMVVCYTGTLWVRNGYTFEVTPLSRDLQAIPVEMDGWHGEDVAIDENVTKMLNAQQAMNRIYRDRDGSSVVASVSAWLRPETVSEVAPHVPKLCYTNSGWSIISEREVTISTPEGPLPFIALLCEKQGERIVVAYWYQMGQSYFNSVSEARRIHRGLWGQRQWPATVKILLQTSAPTFDAGLPRIERFALLLQREMAGVAMPSSSQQ
jgi:EpsI family protein